jgi:zinc finger protein
MATNCDTCGHRSNEVKSGGGIEPKGVRIEVKVRSREDFSRDVLKVRAFLLVSDLLQSHTIFTLI